jgi:transposase
MASATEKKSFTQKKRNFLTLEQRIAALKLLESGQSCRSVAEKFGVGKTQISSLRKDAVEIKQEWESGLSKATCRMKRRKTDGK